MERARRWVGELQASRREWLVLAALLVLGFAIRVAVTIATRHHLLAGDQGEYDATGRLLVQGHPFWGIAPFGEPHPSVWKAPGYGFWVGVLYKVFGESPFRVGMVQAAVGLSTIVLTWLLARRLFNPAVGLVAAAITAVYPLVWQFGALLYPEAIAVPLILWAVYLFLGREPTPWRAAGLGAVIGLTLLVRPTTVFLFPAVLAAWAIAAGWRPAIVGTVISIVVAALVIAPWTIRNYSETNHLVVLSVQDAAVQGTFNDEAAHDKTNPWAWRPLTKEGRAILQDRLRPTEVELHDQLVRDARHYVKEHPSSLLKAFYWNGIVRFWDLRRTSKALDEVKFEGRDRTVTLIGLVMYYLLLPLALVGLFLHRRRMEILVPLLLLALGASVVFAIAATTRYRAPFEPLIAILAAAAFAGPLGRLGDRHLTRHEARA